MGLKIANDKEIKKYFDSDNHISQSKLKLFLKGLRNFLNNQEKSEKELYYSEKGNLLIGSAVDTILTGEVESFSNNFYVSNLDKKPSDTEMSIINMVFDSITGKKQQLENYNELILVAAEEHNWQPRWKADTKIKNIVKVGNEYFNELILAEGKQLLSQEQFMIVNNIVESLKENTNTSKYFDREYIKTFKDIDVYYQLPIYFNINKFNAKALLDIVFIWKNKVDKKLIVKIADLKTMFEDTLQFPKSLVRWRYDIQAAWYTFAIRKFLQENYKEYLDDGWKIEFKRFVWIVESTSIPGRPLIYYSDNKLLDIGINGLKEIKIKDLNLNSNNYERSEELVKKEVIGYVELLNRYNYYMNTNWQDEKVVLENDGILEIGWEGITEKNYFKNGIEKRTDL